MKHRLILREDLGLEDLQDAVRRGGRFVAFSYCISLVAITLRRFSPVYFIASPEMIAPYARRYNTLSRIFGWWCIPWGPLRTSQSIRFNKAGGLDLTEDVMLNLTEDDLRQKVVNILETTLLFQPPEKTDMKAFEKALAGHQNLRLYIQKLVVGLYINTPQPYFVVGIRSLGDFDRSCAALRDAFYTRFLKSVRFEFMDLGQTHEWNTWLEKQGVCLVDAA